MELILERELDHQQKAVDAIISALDGITMIKPHLAYENPTFDRKESRLIHNLIDVQKNIRADYRGCRDDGDYLNLDIKMETGTGKTYVYTHTIYEIDLLNFFSIHFYQCPLPYISGNIFYLICCLFPFFIQNGNTVTI